MSGDQQTIGALAIALRSGHTSARAITEQCLARITESNPAINAFITVLEREALEQAQDADREIAAGRWRGPLHGIPVSLKDLFDLRGTPTTAASAVRRHHVASQDAEVVALLRGAGAVIVGKTNLHEFALGTTNEDSAYGPVRHPLDASLSPGGSSGGSAAAVLAGMCVASVGSDTGGSVRIPAAACGLVGLKPRMGDVSTSGVVPLSRTLDHVGPICRTVDDAAILYHLMRGASPSIERPVAEPARGLLLGVPGGYLTARLDDEVRLGFETACRRLEHAGVRLEEAAMPHAEDAPTVYLHIVLSEAAAYHAATLDRQPEDYTANVRLRLEMGRAILAEDYVRAMRGREVLTREVDAALEGRDAVMLPSLAVPATPLGAATVEVAGASEPVRAITLRQTQLFNLTGHPAISVPCGRTAAGLPVGAQLVGRDTVRLLAVARALEPILGAA